jgi:uncharacterized protein YjbJ (UPF0337 family)
MKILNLVLGFSLFNVSHVSAAIIDCAGTAKVSVAGSAPMDEQLSVKVDMTRGVMVYHGPHGSIDLPSDSAFELPMEIISGHGVFYFYSDASRSGHGGELNRFYLTSYADDIGDVASVTTTRDFYYYGSYDYEVMAIGLSCTRTN